MITALFFMKLDLNRLASDLIKSHIKGAFPSDEYALSIVVLFFNFWDFEHEGYLLWELMIIHEYR